MKNILFILSFFVITGCIGQIKDSPQSGQKIDRVGRDNINIGGDSIGRDSIGRDKTIINQAPSYEDVTIAQGNEGAAISVSSKLQGNNFAIATELFGEIIQGKDVEPKEAHDKMFADQFFINSETEVLVLESNESSKGLGGVVKVRILEGAHKDKEGWVSVSLIKTERRLVSK
jgi:hypothetical protein